MRSLREVFAASTQRLMAELAELRGAFNHPSIKGSGGEGAVINQLRRHLPTSIGITTGQIMDYGGDLSPQVDVILYDATRCPMIFTSPNGENTVPVEGVIACIEVKLHLTLEELRKCVKSAQKIKQMDRRAYLPTPFQFTYNVYDRQWHDHPIYYTVFAFETDNLYAGRLNEVNAGLPPHERIDTICYLDRGVMVNAVAATSVMESAPVTFSPTSTGISLLVDAETENALLVWFLNLTTIVLQASTRPIDLAAYAQEELRLSAHPSTEDVERVKFDEQIMDWMDKQDGRAPGTLAALARVNKKAGEGPTTLTPKEWGDYLWHIAELLEKGGSATLDETLLREVLQQGGAIKAHTDYPAGHGFTASDVDVIKLRAVARQFANFNQGA